MRPRRLRRGLTLLDCIICIIIVCEQPLISRMLQMAATHASAGFRVADVTACTAGCEDPYTSNLNPAYEPAKPTGADDGMGAVLDLVPSCDPESHVGEVPRQRQRCLLQTMDISSALLTCASADRTTCRRSAIPTVCQLRPNRSKLC
jgi:hypothetical protein